MARVTITPAAVQEIERRLTLKPLKRPVACGLVVTRPKGCQAGPERVKPYGKPPKRSGGRYIYWIGRRCPDDDMEEMRPTHRQHGVEFWFQGHGREGIDEVVVDHNN